jgi:uncharacterized protein YndB with AHSA1/START domain
MAAYEFVTIWRISAPIETVFTELVHSELWPTWWKGVEKVVEVQRGDDKGLGNVRRYTWKSKLPYRLTFDMKTTRVEPYTLLEGDASGELEGKGIWHLSTEGGDTIARYDWNVDTTQAWMKLLAPVARPFFESNHDIIMHWGAEGLARRLGVKVVDQKTH